jgi:hypothetical protein
MPCARVLHWATPCAGCMTPFKQHGAAVSTTRVCGGLSKQRCVKSSCLTKQSSQSTLNLMKRASPS